MLVNDLPAMTWAYAFASMPFCPDSYCSASQRTGTTLTEGKWPKEGDWTQGGCFGLDDMWKWKSLSGVWLCDPGDCSPPGSSVHGILQARILEWVVISFSRGSSHPGIEARSPALQADSLFSEPPRSPRMMYSYWNNWIQYLNV